MANLGLRVGEVVKIRLSDISFKKGTIIPKDYEAIKTFESIKIKFIPLWKWMFLKRVRRKKERSKKYEVGGWKWGRKKIKGGEESGKKLLLI